MVVVWSGLQSQSLLVGSGMIRRITLLHNVVVFHPLKCLCVSQIRGLHFITGPGTGTCTQRGNYYVKTDAITQFTRVATKSHGHFVSLSQTKVDSRLPIALGLRGFMESSYYSRPPQSPLALSTIGKIPTVSLFPWEANHLQFSNLIGSCDSDSGFVSILNASFSLGGKTREISVKNTHNLTPRHSLVSWQREGGGGGGGEE